VTSILWAAIGTALGAVVLHTTLGLRRPFDRIHLAFACLMVLVATYLYLEWDVYRASNAEVAIVAKQRQITVVNAFAAAMYIFVPAYSNVRIPRRLMAAYWSGLAIFFVVNLWAPYGLWFTNEPQLVVSSLRDEAYTTLLAPPMGPLQLGYTTFLTSFLIVALGCARKMYRRGERERAVAFAIALILVIAAGIVDVVRHNVGGAWPYVIEYGVVTWGLIMSVQLARDFREQTRSLGKSLAEVQAHARRQTTILDALQTLERDMQRPLAALERGLATLAAATTTEDAQLPRLERGITRLRELADSMPAIRTRRTR
jgi:hypothetical protein